MKNLFILTVFALTALTSCKKDYTCECTTYLDGVSIGSGSETIKDTKSKAKDECDKGDASDSSTGTLIESKCEIK
ncbi:MAG: hypothetical protein NTY55_12685 [Flavobacteriia bacterium]|nr:hypothetical protein [Flavobacteriia bacterium]